MSGLSVVYVLLPLPIVLKALPPSVLFTIFLAIVALVIRVKV